MSDANMNIKVIRDMNSDIDMQQAWIVFWSCARNLLKVQIDTKKWCEQGFKRRKEFGYESIFGSEENSWLESVQLPTNVRSECFGSSGERVFKSYADTELIDELGNLFNQSFIKDNSDLLDDPELYDTNPKEYGKVIMPPPTKLQLAAVIRLIDESAATQMLLAASACPAVIAYSPESITKLSNISQQIFDTISTQIYLATVYHGMTQFQVFHEESEYTEYINLFFRSWAYDSKFLDRSLVDYKDFKSFCSKKNLICDTVDSVKLTDGSVGKMSNLNHYRLINQGLMYISSSYDGYDNIDVIIQTCWAKINQQIHEISTIMLILLVWYRYHNSKSTKKCRQYLEPVRELENFVDKQISRHKWMEVLVPMLSYGLDTDSRSMLLVLAFATGFEVRDVIAADNSVEETLKKITETLFIPKAKKQRLANVYRTSLVNQVLPAAKELRDVKYHENEYIGRDIIDTTSESEPESELLQSSNDPITDLEIIDQFTFEL